ncbi:hypothetical protein GWK47_031474 [Chionoecetes opilio]|uniref:Uncharacterized protein n=1 Tax=Chionoecetes opilio TaxID=41210 RepID=A0A8J5D241_CHIOP|nr:hypothetical protein GWK47_031474 [Chionoecetes opilio]
MLRVASVFISVALAFDPVTGDTPLPPGGRICQFSGSPPNTALTIALSPTRICHTEEAAALLQAVPRQGLRPAPLQELQQDPQDSLAQLPVVAGLVGLPALLAGLVPLDHRAATASRVSAALLTKAAQPSGGLRRPGFCHQCFPATDCAHRHADSLTDTVFQSYGVTLTQFAVQTVTRPIQQVVVTPVDDVVAVATTQVLRPEYITLTETKSDFRLAVRTSVTHVTLTHTSYAITHVPFTITATETVQITSAVVRTVIDTVSRVVTDYRTLLNTVFSGELRHLDPGSDARQHHAWLCGRLQVKNDTDASPVARPPPPATQGTAAIDEGVSPSLAPGNVSPASSSPRSSDINMRKMWAEQSFGELTRRPHSSPYDPELLQLSPWYLMRILSVIEMTEGAWWPLRCPS